MSSTQVEDSRDFIWNVGVNNENQCTQISERRKAMNKSGSENYKTHTYVYITVM